LLRLIHVIFCLSFCLVHTNALCDCTTVNLVILLAKGVLVVSQMFLMKPVLL
jgi:hypothetical protein